MHIWFTLPEASQIHCRTGLTMAISRSRVFAGGDTIIREGDEADFVFTLRRGRAAAYQGGTRIGEVIEGEIFGALAVFSGVARNATVKATTLCRVDAMTKDSFLEQAQRQPDLCIRLIKDMARLIGDLNESLIALSDASQESDGVGR